MKKKSKEISVFVDESGSFEPDAASSRFYMVCMVFHDQSKSISDSIARLDGMLANMGLEPNHCVHAGPLIRREKEYAQMSREERRRIFDRMIAFLRKTDISYRCFCVDKRLLGINQSVHDPLLQQILSFLMVNAETFNSYDALKIYYDNGQAPLTELLKGSICSFFLEDCFRSGCRALPVPPFPSSRHRLYN